MWRLCLLFCLLSDNPENMIQLPQWQLQKVKVVPQQLNLDISSDHAFAWIPREQTWTYLRSVTEYLYHFVQVIFSTESSMLISSKIGKDLPSSEQVELSLQWVGAKPAPGASGGKRSSVSWVLATPHLLKEWNIGALSQFPTSSRSTEQGVRILPWAHAQHHTARGHPQWFPCECIFILITCASPLEEESMCGG